MLVSKSDPKLHNLEQKHEDINSNLQHINESPLMKNSSTTNKRFSPLLRQVLASLSPILATVAAGMTSGFSAILLPQLQETNSTIQITSVEASWIASMAALPMAIGCIIGGVLMEKFGRKMSLIVLNIPFFIGWIMISLAPNLTWILVGRFLTGLCVGLLGAPASVYIGETSEPQYRGFILAAISFAISLGVLISHVAGTFLSWNITAMICAAFPLLAFIFMLFPPESPSWLLSHGRVEDASNAFKWLRGFNSEAHKEFESMVVSQDTSARGSNYSWANVKENIKKPAFLKPLFILLAFFCIMQFAGVNAVAFYCVTIMKDTLGEGLNEYLAMFVIDLVRLTMSIVACILLIRSGRRPLTIISGFGTAISLIGLSVFLYLSAKYEFLQNMSWIPLALLVGYICFVSVGLVPVPWCMTGELFPLALRGVGSGMVSSFNFFSFFVVVKTSPTLFAGIGTAGTFLVYGSIALVGTVFLTICLPETKNKTLQEIENSFSKRKSMQMETITTKS